MYINIEISTRHIIELKKQATKNDQNTHTSSKIVVTLGKGWRGGWEGLERRHVLYAVGLFQMFKAAVDLYILVRTILQGFKVN